MRRLFLPGGTRSAGPYELRLPIFLQPLGGALKNRSAAPASPPCFRRRRTGCGTQHPLRLACVSLAAAPTTPPCFRRRRRSAPLLFESTRLCEADICAKENRQRISTPAVFSWARVDYASRASKKAPQGPFCRRDVWRRPMLFESTLGYALKSFGQKRNSSIFTTLEFLVERSNLNPNHCPLGHLWRRFHRK